MYRRPMRDQGATHLRKTRSYQSPFATFRTIKRVMIAAPSGIPRNAATLVAIVEYDGVMPDLEWLMTFMKKMAKGA